MLKDDFDAASEETSVCDYVVLAHVGHHANESLVCGAAARLVDRSVSFSIPGQWTRRNNPRKLRSQMLCEMTARILGHLLLGDDYVGRSRNLLD